jgi:hypothetical protein
MFCNQKCQQGSVDPDLYVCCNPLFCFKKNPVLWFSSSLLIEILKCKLKATNIRKKKKKKYNYI